MRALGITIFAAVMAFSATAAQAQSEAARGWGAGRRGSDDQKANNAFATVKKTDQDKRFPLGASWIAVSLNGKPYTGAERPAFSLDEQFRVRGFGGCNSFATSAFPLREQGFAVGPLALTKRACDKGKMDSEMAFLTALRTSAKWDTQIGTLIIKGPNGELRFERSL
ncbi:META domain-containing protein [Enterovirga sp.]|uniref:META domain-containing protein n=1 Tax=Enterovirga sp. TaxID=2026350 RepID=UPI002C806BF1|nr:META domain-containing protein [Enterovirga sp.]HMO28653.1 META domain-containing protein [Enterovirga sp.]